MTPGGAQPDLVPLFYRADWTALSLSATVAGFVDFGVLAEQAAAANPLGGHAASHLQPAAELGVRRFAGTLRLEPGGRFGLQVSEPAEFSLDDRLHLGSFTQDGFRSTSGTAPADPPYLDLLRPVRLLNGFTLALADDDGAGYDGAPGRRVLPVVATADPGLHARRVARPERIKVLADALTGILLRSQETYGGQVLRLTELTDVVFGPPGDPYAPPAGDDAQHDEASAGWHPAGPSWTAARTAANVGGTVLGAAVRHAPRQHRTGTGAGTPDPWAQMPPDSGGPAPEDGTDQVSDELLHALHSSGRAEFTGTLHHWVDTTALGEWTATRAGKAGLEGLGSLAGAFFGRVGVVHTVHRAQAGGSGRYRVQTVLEARDDRPQEAVCDGAQLWRQYADKVVIGPAGPPKGELAEMMGASALLEHQISGIREVTIDGRRAFALLVSAGSDSWDSSAALKGAEVVVDAELGILLRLVRRGDGRPFLRTELRDVSAGCPGGEDFTWHGPPGLRVVRVDGTAGDDILAAMPGPVRDAAKLAGRGFRLARRFAEAVSDQQAARQRDQ